MDYKWVFRAVLIALIALVVLDVLGARCVSAQSPPRPNILFIYTDDQAAWTVSHSPDAHPQARTPNIDDLAREGALLTNAFVTTPVCSPSRASLLTGRYGTEVGIVDAIHPQFQSTHGLAPAAVTWTELLEEAGYRTGLIGKWHLGTLDRYHPTRQGFGTFTGFLEGGHAPKDPTLEKDGQQRRFRGFTQDVLTSQAIEFMQHSRSEPFALLVSYRVPHRRWLPLPEEDWAPYQALTSEIPDDAVPNLDAAEVKSQLRRYLGAVASVDRNVGRLLDALTDLGLSEHTVVVFTSDHGYQIGHHGLSGKGNAFYVLTDRNRDRHFRDWNGETDVSPHVRPNLHDRSLRVPVVVRWPNHVPPGTTVDEVITNLDWYPTLLEMAHVERPDSITIRGRSFVSLLRGRDRPNWDEAFYAEYSMVNRSRADLRAWRTREWKLVRDVLNPERSELYHLAEDPREMINLIERSSPEVQKAIEQLDRKILEQMRQLHDPLVMRFEALFGCEGC